jgi:segregation and condensation protein B
MSEIENDAALTLDAKLEALLFVATEPVALSYLATALEITPAKAEKGLKVLQERLAESGLRLQRHRGRVQLTTVPHASALIERFLGLDATSRLSRAALETLAIIAYEQPVTRPQVDAIRGVNSDGVMRSLLSKGLIEEGGRAEGPGRPILYNTTPEFLQHFGLASVTDLPNIDLSDVVAGDVDHEILKG